MIHRIFAALLALAAAIANPSTASAGLPTPDFTPQWLQTFSRDAPAQDSFDSLGKPAIVRLNNGEIVMLTVLRVPGSGGDSLLARRFSAVGALLQTRLLAASATGVYSHSPTIVRIDPTNGDIVALAGSTNCHLLRLSSTLDLKWSIPTPTTTPASNQCVSLHVLSDGSAAAADGFSLSRISRDGKVLWTVQNGDDGRYLFPKDMLLDGSGVLWVASQGGVIASPAGSNSAAILRFDLDGQRLSADTFICGSCIANRANTIDLLPNGDVIAAGSAGSNQPGFFVRYAANGMRVLLIDTEQNIFYKTVAHDDDGNVYALTGGNSAVKEIRRLDATTGAVLWALPAEELGAAAHGIVAFRRTGGSVSAHGISSDGSTAWNRVLSSTVNAVFTRAQRRGDGVELMLNRYDGSAPENLLAPTLLALDAAGNPSILAQSATMPGSTTIASVDAIVDTGVLINTQYALSAYAPDGDLRWRASSCNNCDDKFWVASALTASGGAWAFGFSTVKRFNAQGQEILSLPLELAASSSYEPYVLADDDQAKIIGVGQGSLIWQRAQLSPAGVERKLHPVRADSTLAAVRQLDDGGVGVTLQKNFCAFVCLPGERFLSVLRLTSNGDLAWRYDVPEGGGVVALDHNGGAYVVTANASSLLLRSISPDGNPGADIAMPSVQGGVVRSLHGPRDGRLLLVIGNADWWSIGLDGAVLAHRQFTAGYNVGKVLDVAAPGFLATADTPQASGSQLIDPATLETRATFHFNNTLLPNTYFNPLKWRLLDDGVVFGAEHYLDASRLTQPRLARFTTPNSGSTNLIYRAGFD